MGMRDVRITGGVVVAEVEGLEADGEGEEGE